MIDLKTLAWRFLPFAAFCLVMVFQAEILQNQWETKKVVENKALEMKSIAAEASKSATRTAGAVGTLMSNIDDLKADFMLQQHGFRTTRDALKRIEQHTGTVGHEHALAVGVNKENGDVAVFMDGQQKMLVPAACRKALGALTYNVQ